MALSLITKPSFLFANIIFPLLHGLFTKFKGDNTHSKLKFECLIMMNSEFMALITMYTSKRVYHIEYR